MTNRTIFLTTALPYANGNFHFGHIMEYIQADIWVRHQRMCGSTVHFVGADDAHGAPIMISAQKKGVTPQEYVAEISAGRAKYLNGFFIRFDHWHSTDSKENTELAQDIYKRLKKAGLIYSKEIEQYYDPVRQMFLADRFIKGLINKKTRKLPTSNTAVKNTLIKQNNINLTPQESEQLSKFVADDGYVKKQKEDIEELAAMFKQMLGDEEEAPEPPSVYEDDIIEGFYENFHPETGFAASYVIIVPDMGKNLVIHVGKVLQCEYGADVEADVKLKASSTMLRNILAGKNSFQKGFMSGEITAKGNFKTLRMLDQIFHI